MIVGLAARAARPLLPWHRRPRPLPPPLPPQNPFGAAKPREAVIAEKLGKTEEEVLKEEVSKEKLHVSRVERGWCRCTTAPAAAAVPGWAQHIAPLCLACCEQQALLSCSALEAACSAACRCMRQHRQPAGAQAALPSAASAPLLTHRTIPHPRLPCAAAAPERRPAGGEAPG